MAAPAAIASGVGLTSGMHTAWIYSDMTVDGPEIGTLVIIIDRAKNLPNRKTLGKQNPYCAARLGKDAKKTKTDVRGGQTPKWDQELRFTVHDSPDYNNLKLSVFNDDKKTDLIGETWINLEKVVKSGGGRDDSWHSLNYREKYAGEVRMEMSYYDSRQPERPIPDATLMTGRRGTPVKRRPLPSEFGSSSPAPSVTPAFGPRDYGRPRMPSSASSTSSYAPHPGYPMDNHRHSMPGYSNTPPIQEYYHEEAQDDFQQQTSMPDFLPTLPPQSSSRPRVTTHSASRSHSGTPTHAPLMHSQSAPSIHDPYRTQSGNYYGEEEFHPGMAPAQNQYHDPYNQVALPPLPPSHSNTPPQNRSNVPSISPLQTIERNYEQNPNSPVSPARSDDYQRSPYRPGYDINSSPSQGAGGPSPLRHEITPGYPGNRHSHPVSPQDHQQALSLSVAPSPTQSRYSPRNPPPMNRHSVSDPYATTPPRTHPLSQEVRRSVSPQPYYGNQGYTEPRDYHFPAEIPLVKPRPISPQPQRSSIASIQHPVQTFVSNQNMPSADTRAPRSISRITPNRKSVSPRPVQQGTSPAASGIPFSPDAFDVHNPTSRTALLANNPNPHSPYHIPAPPKRPSSTQDMSSRYGESSGPITRWDGSEVDPSDHLPIDSWAPEPEQKTPIKPYAGSTHGFGPRTTPGSGGNSEPRRGNIVVNVRTKGRSDEGYGRSPVYAPDSPGNVLREIDVPNPYSQNAGRYSDPNFAASTPTGGRRPGAPYDGSRRSYGGQEDWNTDPYANSYGAPPPKPPKIPQGGAPNVGYGESALSREMASIDIGGSRRGAPSRGTYERRSGIQY